MTCGAVVVTWNGERYLEACIRSLLSQTLLPRHLIIVDNHSSDQSVDIVRTLVPEALRLGLTMTVIEERSNHGFPAGANRGLTTLLAAEGGVSFSVLLNQDATVDSTWCASVAATFASDPAVGAVGSRILLPNRLTIQHAGGYLELPRMVGRHHGHHQADHPQDFNTAVEVEYVTAAAMALRADALAQVGVFDEVFSPGYYEDVDWCARARAQGWRIVYSPVAVAVHVESASFSLRPDRLSVSHRNRLIFALPRLADNTFRDDFARAEREYLVHEAPAEDQRALGVAYLWFLLLLPDLVASGRIPAASTALLAELIEVFAELRRDALTVTG